MAKILCIGDNNVDIYAGEGLVYPGGNSLNVAVYSRLNGEQAAYIGNLGRDFNGSVQADALREVGVDISRVRWWEEPTSSAEVTLRDGDREFSAYQNAVHTAHPLALDAEDLAFCKGYDYAHTSLYSLFAPGALKQLDALGLPVSFDFSQDFTDEDIAQNAPFVTFGFFSTSHLDEVHTRALLEEACEAGVRIAVATMGERGALLFDGESFVRQDAYAIQPVDTMGAGDSFIARFLQCYMDGELQLRRCNRRLAELGREELRPEGYLWTMTAHALSQATLYAASNCLRAGAFGHEKRRQS